MKSLAMLEERVERVAGEVERAMTAPLGALDVGPSATWITTGAGASEGPARLLAALLRRKGRLADFTPVSAFVGEPPPADVCVVVSQRLSPNARVPLGHAGAYERVLLVTTVASPEPALGKNVRVIRHGPSDEGGLLLRVVGPAAANAIAIRLAQDGAGSRIDLGDAHTRTGRSLTESAATLTNIVGIVAVGADVTLCDGLRHKMLEGLGKVCPLWDLCGLVHGPLQAFFDREATLVLLERDTTPPDLVGRLLRVLQPDRHRVVRLRSSMPGPLAVLDFDVQLDWLLLEALRAQPRDLMDWPGKGHDAPLYELGAPRKEPI
jgi:hypothetical protein